MKPVRFAARFALILLALLLLVFPLDTTLHEGGHAAMALLTTRGNVTLNTGFGQRGLDFSVGRLHIHLAPLPTIYGFSDYDRRGVSRQRRALINLAGPCVSLLLALSFGIVFRRRARLRPPLRMLCLLFSLANLFQFLGTVLPIRYPQSLGSYRGRMSDGAAALQDLR